ncbi:DsrE family protein [Thermodesulfatator atlanticus]|uniref:DsrE family protein n=1 Tax=Thermodesulfatator atlanticus TaxID=501497 RepID=UPI0003B3B65C|nr:DsrE family protein [Thermodesulfatator atlanticus]
MPLKLVIHVPESTRYKVALKMGINFLKTKAQNEELLARVLVNAQGITVLLELDDEMLNLMEDFKSRGGEIHFCKNAMKAFNVPEEKVPEGCYIVPAGIRALVEWQEEGFRYVRA